MISPVSMAVVFEPGYLLVKVGASELVVEMKGSVWQFVQRIQKALIETSSIYRLYVLLRVKFAKFIGCIVESYPSMCIIEL